MKHRHSIARSAKHLMMLVAAASVVSGCSSSSSPSEPDVLTGQIVDTAIAGLSYSTATQSGTTDTSGEFQYIQGETVSFSVGGFQIAEIPAKATINWFELGGLTTIPVGREQIDRFRYDNDDPDADGIYDGPSLGRVGAIASVLVTLDEDRNAANGIVIAPAVAALMTSDLHMPLTYSSIPRYTGGFKKIIRYAASEGLLSARQVRNGALEVAALYERMEINPNFQAFSRHFNDNDADGLDDRVRMLTYDAATGRVLRDEYDNDADGNLDLVVTLEYTPEVDNAFYTRDDGNDGVDLTRSWTHDVFGDLAVYEEFRNGSLYQRETRDLDPLTGLYVRREVVNPSRNVHTIETWTMDGEGNRPLATIDYDGDGTPEVVVTLRYDAPNSLWTYREDDTNGDGAADAVSTRTFNADGNLLTEQRDENADGTVDWVKMREYDAFGRPSREAIDSNNDGIFETDNTWERNSRGQTLSSRRLESGTLSYADVATYDTAGNRLTYSVDRNGDGDLELAVTSVYDANSNLIETRTDNNGDGTIDVIETRSYNASGLMVERQYDDGADGTIEAGDRNTFNTDGYRTLRESFRNGVLSSTARYEGLETISIAITL